MNINKITVVPASVKTGKGDNKEIIVNSDKWIIAILTDAGSVTAADWILGNNKADFAVYGKAWSSKDYAIHYAGELADKIADGRVTSKVADRLVEANKAWNEAEGKRKAAAQWRKEHKDEVALSRLQKAADGAKKAKSETVKKFGESVSGKAQKLVDLLHAVGEIDSAIVDVDSALDFIQKQKAADKAA